jgi:hypothetical protein
MPYEECHKIIDEIEHKKCSICEEWLPMIEEFFYKNKSSKRDGFNPYCKKCAKKKSLKYRSENRNQSIQSNKIWKENNRDRYLDGLRAYRQENKEEVQIYTREWQRNNPDKVKGYNKDKQLNKKHDISKGEWENCKNYFSYRCAYCGLPIEEHWVKYKGNVFLGDFHKDHVDDDGANDLSNCVPACKSCNCKKHDFTLEEWYYADSHKCDCYSFERLQKIYKW